MKIPAGRLYLVSDEIPVEFHPIMAAFMSYFWRVIDKKSKHKKPEYKTDGAWRRVMPLFYRKGLFKKKLTKSDGTFMSPIEQLELFVDSAAQNGKNIACYLFENGSENPITKINKKENAVMKIPVIQLENGQYAATSWNSGFNFE